MLAEVDSALDADAEGTVTVAVGARRTVLDRRGHTAGGADRRDRDGEPVLAVCADVPRRLEGLRARVGGFTLACYAELEREPR